MAGTFQCTLVTPEQQLLDDPVLYASIPAHDGQIGLAPGRAPLLVQLGDGALRLDFEEGGARWFFIGGGFAQMKDNRLSIVADEAVPAEQIVKTKAEEDMAEAQKVEARHDAFVHQRSGDVELFAGQPQALLQGVAPADQLVDLLAPLVLIRFQH